MPAPANAPISSDEYNAALIRPPANVSFFGWLFLLGLPILLLFLIYAKMQPNSTTETALPAKPAAEVMQAPHGI